MSNEETKVIDGAADDKAVKSEAEKAKTPPANDELDDDLKDLSPEQLKKKILEARSESKKRREESKSAKEEAKSAKEEAAALKKAKEDEETEKKKKAGEWEKVANEKDAALQKANDRTKRAELRLFAQKEGILDPSDVNSLSLESLTIDDNDEVHGAEKVIKKLKEDKPHWFKPVENAAAKKAEEEKPRATSSGKTEPPPGKGGSDADLPLEERKKAFFATVKARR